MEFWEVQFTVEWSNSDFDQKMRQLLLPNWIDQPELEPEAVFCVVDDEDGKPKLKTPSDAPSRADKPHIVDTLERRLQLYLGSTHPPSRIRTRRRRGTRCE